MLIILQFVTAPLPDWIHTTILRSILEQVRPIFMFRCDHASDTVSYSGESVFESRVTDAVACNLRKAVKH